MAESSNTGWARIYENARGVVSWFLRTDVSEENKREAKQGIAELWSCLMKKMTFDLKGGARKALTHSKGLSEAVLSNNTEGIRYCIDSQVRSCYQLGIWPEEVFTEIKAYVEHVCTLYPHEDHEDQKAALLKSIKDVEDHINEERSKGAAFLNDYDGKIGLTGNTIAIHQSLCIMNAFVPFEGQPAYPRMTETFGQPLCLIDRDADGGNLIRSLKGRTHYPSMKRACRAIQGHLDNVRSVIEDVDPGFQDSVLEPLEEAIAAGATHHPLKGGYLAAELRSVQANIEFIGREIGALQTVHENLGRMI